MSEPRKVSLHRTLGPILLCLYGLGNILGAGIYVLVGAVAGQAGMLAPLAFLVAGAVAALSAFSYGELSARCPVSAGEAVWVQEAFGVKLLSVLTGALIATAGLTSSAALARGFAGYLQVVLPVPQTAAIVALVFVLGALAVWGVNESVRVAAGLTIIEAGGLLLVAAVAAAALAGDAGPTGEFPSTNEGLHGIAAGAFVAFFAFLGFEDMVNMAEEVENPQRTMPLAIIAALFVSTVLYVVVAAVAVMVVDPETLALDDAPLALVYASAGGRMPEILGLIGMAAIVNGVLVQIIMASRVTYGMSREGWIAKSLSRIHPRTQTPVRATALVCAVVVGLALSFELSGLAHVTSALVLMIFVMVNIALLIMKRRNPQPPGVKPVSMWFPVLGASSAALLLLLFLFGS